MEKKHGLLIKMSYEQHRKLKIYAATRCKTMKEVILEWLDAAVEEHNEKIEA